MIIAWKVWSIIINSHATAYILWCISWLMKFLCSFSIYCVIFCSKFLSVQCHTFFPTMVKYHCHLSSMNPTFVTSCLYSIRSQSWIMSLKISHLCKFFFWVRTPWLYGYMALRASEQNVGWIGVDCIPLRLLWLVEHLQFL